MVQSKSRKTARKFVRWVSADRIEHRLRLDEARIKVLREKAERKKSGNRFVRAIQDRFFPGLESIRLRKLHDEIFNLEYDSYKRKLERLSDSEAHKEIFQTANQLYEMRRNVGDSRMVFIGTGMRPIFDTVRALNETDKKFPRNHFRYFVTPNSAGDRRHFPEFFKAVKTELVRRKIVTPGKKTYYIVDYMADGKTIDLLWSAIKELVPFASVILISNREHGRAGYPAVQTSGIDRAEVMLRPTTKIVSNGKVILSGETEGHTGRENYRIFQYALQKWLEKRGKKPRL
jgi:hypothetical protein